MLFPTWLLNKKNAAFRCTFIPPKPAVGNYTPPKRRFCNDEQKINADFEGSTFQGREYSIWATSRWNSIEMSAFHLLFIVPKSSFGAHKLVPFFFDNLPHWVEHFDKSVNHKSTLKCLSKCSTQWGRLSKKRGLVADGCPKRRFWKEEQKMKSGFRRKHLSIQGREYSIWATNHWKVCRKSGFHLLFFLPKSSFGAAVGN